MKGGSNVLTAAAVASRPLVIGLTGSIGMGKSTATSFLRRAGIPVHDADAAVHKAYAPGGQAVGPVTAAFPSALGADGGIDRPALSAAILQAGREASLRTLESIVHPLVAADRACFVQDAADQGAWLVVLDVPLLFESMDEAARRATVDKVLVVSAPVEVQRERVLSRPGMTAEKLEAVLARQLPDAEKRARADFVVETGYSGYTQARAQLATVLHGLANRHAAVYSRWRAGPALATSAPRAIRGVSFDLDDTIWPVEPPLAAAAAALVEQVTLRMPNVARAGLATRAKLREAMTRAGEQCGTLVHDMTEMRRVSLSALAREHGDDPAAVDEVMEFFLRARSDVVSHLYPDVRAAISELRGAGLMVGALTNGNADIRMHEETADLFDFYVRASDAGAAKPAAAPFWFGAAAAGLHPSEMVHIGDAVVNDLVGALDAGMAGVLLSRPEQMPRHKVELESMPSKDDARWREVAGLGEATRLILEERAFGPVEGRDAAARKGAGGAG